jgi:hypothetical protein
MEARLWTKEEILELIREELLSSNLRGGTMKKPTVQEIADYMESLNILNTTENANKFFDFYTANGWKVGKVAMKSWQSAIKTWKFPKKASKVAGYSFIYVSEIRKMDIDSDPKLAFMYKYLRATVDKLYYAQAEEELFVDWFLALEELLNNNNSYETIGKVANFGFNDLFWKKNIYNLPKFAKHFIKIKQAMIENGQG